MPRYRITTANGGIPFADEGAAVGSLVTMPGQVQFGSMLMGAGTSAGWRELINWRALPAAQVADSLRPQAHGSYPGDVLGDALTVTFTYQVTGTVDARARAIDAIERGTPMDGVDRPLVVDDGFGAWQRTARVIAREVPQDMYYLAAAVECSVQFLCADPRRYSMTEKSLTVTPPTSEGGLVYPLTYPLDYGTFTAGGGSVVNDGTVRTPVQVRFVGPLTSPVLTCSAGWRMGFDLNLGAGEQLVVDAAYGSALLDGTADRLYTLQRTSDPLERCLLAPGEASLSLIAAAGDGHAVVSFRDARM